MPDIKSAMTIGVFVLVVALLLPAVISAADSDQSKKVELTEGETIEVKNGLAITGDDINPSGDNATVTVFNQDTLNGSTQQLNDTETKYFVVDGYNTSVSANNTFLSDNSRKTSRLTIGYNPYFNWNGGATIFFQNLELLLVIVGGIMVLGLAGIASKW